MTNLKKYQGGWIQVPLGAFLAASSLPLVIQVLTGLGIGLITFTGVTSAINLLITNARGSYNSLPNAVLGLAGLAGIGEAFGIITAAILVRMAISFLPKFGRLPSA